MAGPAIRTYAYDSARNELTLNFGNGRAYVYSLVPPGVFTAFEAAPSKGAFHNTQLRERYPFRKMKAAAKPSAAMQLREVLLASTREEEAVLPPERPRERR